METITYLLGGILILCAIAWCFAPLIDAKLKEYAEEKSTVSNKPSKTFYNTDVPITDYEKKVGSDNEGIYYYFVGYCGKCGHPINTHTGYYCSNCGSKVNIYEKITCELCNKEVYSYIVVQGQKVCKQCYDKLESIAREL